MQLLFWKCITMQPLDPKAHPATFADLVGEADEERRCCHVPNGGWMRISVRTVWAFGFQGWVWSFSAS